MYDVAILSDFRYPGGTSASVAEEIQAQAEAGFSTVLVQVHSPFLKSARGMNPRIADCIRRGQAELALKAETVKARVLVVRQPRIFTVDLESVPRVEAEEVVMVLNQGPRDIGGARDYYDLHEVRERIERYFGDKVRWVVIGPLVREQVEAIDPTFPLEPVDWHNIIDVEQWWHDRAAPVAEVPVIGRHSRPAPVKWPRTGEEIEQVYPTTADFRVRILGGGEIATERVGHAPASWDLLAFGSVHPKQFLRTIDYFAYFHDVDLVEAFGRAILEAMASGTPVILPEHFRALFEDAALYAAPGEVQDVVRALHADWTRYRAVSARARDFVDERFGYRSHVWRLRELGAGTTSAADAVSGWEPAQPSPIVQEQSYDSDGPRHTGPPAARVMMLSSNGAGLGHLTRLMSIARRLPGDLQTVIATQSYAASVVERSGYLTEYIPSAHYLGVPAARWNEFLHDRLRALLEIHQPEVVAVDGTVPYNGLLSAIAEHPEVTWVWVRRAMWKKDQGQRWIERGKAFDLILEPGEFAGAVDVGPTVAMRHEVKTVGPITFLDESELLDADAARLALGLDEQPTALLQLGAGNINDISSPIARISRYLMDRGYRIALAQSPIATKPITPPPGALVASLYPLSRYIRAFDLVVSAAGYNSFHELLGFGVPSVFIPNPQTALDDQVARVRYAAEQGASLALYDPESVSEVEAVLGQAISPDVRAGLVARCGELAMGNGAAEAANWMSGLLPRRGNRGV